MSSDPSLGFVLTRQNAHVQVIRKDDGGVSLVDLRTLAAIDLCAAERDQLREMLDRAAMPGQRAGGSHKCCEHCEHFGDENTDDHRQPCPEGCNELD